MLYTADVGTLTVGSIEFSNTGDNQIISGGLTLAESLMASQLSADELDVTVHVGSRETADALIATGKGTAVEYTFGELSVRFRLVGVERVAKWDYRITCTSPVGWLDYGTKHYGGIYDGQDAAVSGAEAVIADIIGGAFAYTVTGFEDVRLYGWLPIASRRENLQQVLFAIGGNITKDAQGDVVISPLADTISDTVEKSETFLGGKVTYPAPASAVRVTEHSYAKSPEEKEIYSGEIMNAAIFPPSGGPTSENMYDPAMPTSHWYAGSGIVVDATDHFDSVLIPCEPGVTYEATRTRIRATGDVLRICWIKEAPISYETRAYNNALAPIDGTVGETMSARTTTGSGARYLLITYGYTADIGAKNSLDVHAMTVSGQIVEFSEPYYDLECAGSTIIESGPNYAVLSAAASAALIGRPYVHNTKVVTVYAEEPVGSDYIPEVKDCTLVSIANSTNVAQRVLAYYGGFKRVEQDIVVTGQRPGDRVQFWDPYGEKSGGYIKELNLKLGALLRGSAVFDTGYIPSGIGNNYKSVMAVTESGTVQLPQTNRVRLVLIGGGMGGGGGYPGKAGKLPTEGSSSSSGTSYRMTEGDESGFWPKELNDDDGRYSFNGAGYPTDWYRVVSAGRQWDAYHEEYLYVIYAQNMLAYVKQRYPSEPNPERLVIYPGRAYEAGYMYRYKTKYECYAMLGIITETSGKKFVMWTTLEPERYSTTSTSYWAQFDSVTEGGAGGSGGSGGAGGRVFQMDVECTPGEDITVTIGTGGAGGAAGDGESDALPGAEGTATVVTFRDNVLSSADGQSSTFINVLNGESYSGPGDDGQAGGAGGSAVGAHTMYPGENVGGYTGGAVAEHTGSGGGASATANGGDGVVRSNTNHTGSGGAGADAGAPAAPMVYGRGGTGGNGGGGGGNAEGYDVGNRKTLGTAGAGGAGSAGGVGAPGAVLIFYGDPVPEIPADALKDWYRQVMTDADGKTVTVSGGYRSKYSGWQIDDFIEEVLNG